MPENKGVVATGSRDLNNLVTVKEVPYPVLEDDIVIVKAAAYAVNPTDWKHILPEEFVSSKMSGFFRKLGFGILPLENVFGTAGSTLGNCLGKTFSFVQKGVVLGTDVSGVVVDVGKNVTRVKKGDVVAGSVHGGISKYGAFSDFVMVAESGILKFDPSQIHKEALKPGEYPNSKVNSYEAAASVALALKTTGISLHHNLKVPANKAENQGNYILIWGGATATGFVAIQVAKLVYGLKVITTASSKHHERLLALGADKAIDYNDSDAIAQIREAGQNKIKYGMDCVSSVDTLQQVYDATEGCEDVRIDNLLFLDEKLINRKPERKVTFTSTNGYLSDGRRHFGIKASPEMMKEYLEFWNDYAPTVLDKIKTAPLYVLPTGLESANEGLKLMVENKVNGKKVVFRNGQGI